MPVGGDAVPGECVRAADGHQKEGSQGDGEQIRAAVPRFERLAMNRSAMRGPRRATNSLQDCLACSHRRNGRVGKHRQQI